MELAIQKDCEAIIESFNLNENPRFESFVYQWKATRFYSIYTAQSNSLEMIKATNACMHSAKRILAYKNTMQRLGALYLLYAVYFKQPTQRFHKIDIDQNEWIKLREFCLDGMHEEAKCIFWELLKENAFRFVASDIYVGLENMINLDKIRSTNFNLSKTLHVFHSDVRYLTCHQGLVSGISKLEDGYNEMKELMNQTSKPGCTMPLTKTFDDLQVAVNSLSSFVNKNSLFGKKSKKQKGKLTKVKKGGVSKPKRRTANGPVIFRSDDIYIKSDAHCQP